MKGLLIALLLVPSFSFALEIQDRKSLLIFANKIVELRQKKDKVKYAEMRAIEEILYKSGTIERLLERDGKVKRKLSVLSSLTFDKANQSVTFKTPLFKLTQRVVGDDLVQEYKRNFKNHSETVTPGSFDREYFRDVREELYDITLKSKGLGILQETDLDEFEYPSIMIQEPKAKSFRLMIKEKMYSENQNDNTDWIYAPVKLISYPIQKVMYDVPDMVTSTVVESVTRSPKDNLLGAVDEFKGAGKQVWNGFKDIFRGILNPTSATAVDGTLEVVDSAFKVTKGALSLAKTGISMVGYPLYRLAGGKKSERIPLKGKRATIVIIDTGTGPGIDHVLDTYGETIIRQQLKSVSSYYCVSSNAEDNDTDTCIENMPDDIAYLDLIALTHTGGMSDLNFIARQAIAKKGVKPELMISIGCTDDPSKMTEKENTVGQQGISWAVHFYLSNMLSKRLRGIPLPVAASEAFYENYPENVVNPVTMIGIAGVFAMGGEGYSGSAPSTITDDEIVNKFLNSNWRQLKSLISDLRWSRSKDWALINQVMSKMNEFHNKVSENIDQIQMEDTTRSEVINSIAKLTQLNETIMVAQSTDDIKALREIIDQAYIMASK